jgi:hypothetical protein
VVGKLVLKKKSVVAASWYSEHDLRSQDVSFSRWIAEQERRRRRRRKRKRKRKNEIEHDQHWKDGASFSVNHHHLSCAPFSYAISSSSSLLLSSPRLESPLHALRREMASW